ncbi:MAG: 3-phosphoshikimate 1-carboxyvinyltransferase [Muribaculaceae bacterium]|nr:3-phosphoshikimate 1-carboxyvinyltransferase [Muribaculaceae bacterium]
MDYRIFPPEEIIETAVTLPLSKSISARALIMAALGSSVPSEVADCADTRVMTEALASESDEINIGHAGTAMRFLTAYYAAAPAKSVTLDGSERMRQRPIGVLVDTLRSLGASIEYLGEEGFPPLKINGCQLSGGEIEMDSSVSSQFVSAVLMVAPTMKEPLTLKLSGETVSAPYIKMTASMMRDRGIDVEIERDTITVRPGSYRHCDTPVEHDWSAAAFWYEIAAISAGWVTLTGMHNHSIQGDSALAGIYPRMGVLTEWTEEGAELSATPDLYSRVDLDMTDTPDLVQAIAVTSCAIGLPFRLTGVSNLRHKETDRLEALQRELMKVGCVIEIESDSVISWEGRRMPMSEMPEIDTYGDHRMAMAFAPLAMFIPGIIIRDAEVVEKSYPAFWNDLREAGFTITDAAQTE